MRSNAEATGVMVMLVLREAMPPQSDRALLADFAVRRQALRGKHVQGRNGLRARQIGGDQKIEKCFDQFAQQFRPACCRPPPPCRLRSVACHSRTMYSALAVVVSPESDWRALRIANQPADRILKRRVAAERLEQITDCGMSHGDDAGRSLQFHFSVAARASTSSKMPLVE